MEVCSIVSVLSHRFHICLQMHDIVKAVGNCSYNQLVEKIISCKQSDSSELAGEGECRFLIVPAPLPSPSSPLRFLIILSLHGRCLLNHTCWNKTGKYMRFLIKWAASAAHSPLTVPAEGNFSTKNICSFNTELPESLPIGLMPSRRIKASVGDQISMEDSLPLCFCSTEMVHWSGLKKYICSCSKLTEARREREIKTFLFCCHAVMRVNF